MTVPDILTLYFLVPGIYVCSSENSGLFQTRVRGLLNMEVLRFFITVYPAIGRQILLTIVNSLLANDLNDIKKVREKGFSCLIAKTQKSTFLGKGKCDSVSI